MIDLHQPAPSRPPASGADADGVTVLSIPHLHVYPQTIRPARVTYIEGLERPGPWRPHPALDAGWWTAERAAGIDVVHLHFGYEHRSAAQTADLVAALREHSVGLVVTVHDVDNPHLADPAEQAQHHERTRILAQAADAVITLTEQARGMIHELAGNAVAVEVVPHPRVVPPTQRPDQGAAAIAGARRPGVFLKSLRSNVVADADFYAFLAEAGTVVYAHDEPATEPLRRELSARGVDVVAHPPMDDATLHATVGACSAVVLPYIRGTHSGWLEMCRDLGVGVAVPDCGCYAGQADRPEAVLTYPSGDGRAAAAAVRELSGRAPVPYRGDRAEQLEKIRHAHATIYAAVRRNNHGKAAHQ